MSGFFVNRKETTRVTFEDGPLAGFYVQLRTELSFQEQQNINISGLSVEIDEGGKTSPVMAESAIASREVRKMLVWVTGWNLPRGGGSEPTTEWEPTRQSLEDLTVPAARQIVAAIAKHEAGAQEEAEIAVSPFPAAGSSPTPTSQPAHDGTTETASTSMTS